MNAEGSVRPERVNGCRRSPAPPAAEATATDRLWSAQTVSLRVSVHTTEDSGATVRLVGEVDIASAALISDALQKLPCRSRHHIRLDLTEVSFCDCAGLNAFIASHRVQRAAGNQFTIVHPSAPTRRLLELTRLDRVLTLESA